MVVTNTPPTSPQRGEVINMSPIRGANANVNATETMSTTESMLSIGNRLRALTRVLFTMVTVAELISSTGIFALWLVMMLGL